MWHISLAKYNTDKNAVEESRVSDFENQEFSVAIDALNKASETPIYLWNDLSVNTDSYFSSIVETDAYKKEYAKVID